MKARIDNNGNIKKYLQMPKYWANFAGNFHKQSDEVHESFGFYPVVEPEYNTKLQRLGVLVFNENDKVFEYAIEDIDYNLDELKQGLKDELKELISEVSGIVARIKTIYNPLDLTPENIPDGFKMLVQQLVPIKTRVINDIDSLESIEDALDFKVYSNEANQYLESLKSFL